MIKLNGKPVTFERFPNGETLLATKYLDIVEFQSNVLEMRFETDQDIMNMFFLKNHLDNLNVETILKCRYLPYSRMDRTEGHALFTLKYICKLINDLKFKYVEIYEPHSDVCVALLDRVKVVNSSAIIADWLIKDLYFTTEDYIVYPDAGACKRYSKQINYYDGKVLTCSKERDFKTGHINKLTVEGEKPNKPFRAVIIDDLCSKGGTFVLTAQKLKEMGATDIYLVVTHCENTILEGDIIKTDLIKRVYTTSSIFLGNNPKIQVVNV